MEDHGLALDPPPAADFAACEPHRSPALVWLFAGLVSAGIALYAFTRAFVWDEGFHLVAAQMILAGKKPYLDFCFPQTPLNAYWNALWMRVLHQSWRVSHIPAVLELDGAVVLLTRYLLSRFPDARWRSACTLAGIAFLGVNATMVQFGPIAQAYAICAFTLTAAFIFATDAVQKPQVWCSVAAGLSIGCGAASSLLIAPAAPVILLWLWFKNVVGSRSVKAAAFLVGSAIPFAPVVWLFVQGPHQTWFNIVTYQAMFRRADWKPDTAFSHDFDVLTGWYDSGQILLLCSCALAAVLFFRRHKEFGRFRSEFWLALWMSLSLVAYIATAHPTFGRYFIVGMPLYAIVAAPGLMVIALRFSASARPRRAASALLALLLFGLLRAQVTDLDAATWDRYEQMASAIAGVTPPAARLLSDEHIYFLLHRAPPPGMEFSYSHKVDVPAKEAALLHIIPIKELKSQISKGQFATIQTCDDDKIDDWNLASLYKQRKDIADCSIFWDYEKH